MKKLILILLIFFSSASIYCQFVDSVRQVVFGPNYSIGYGPDNQYFPQCIYGRHDTAARPNAPSTGPQNLLSLGTGGIIILRFFRPIINGPGVDFTVFENPFMVGSDTTNVFAEVGIIGVSRDGVNFIDFLYRWDTLSPGRYRYHNLAGATPVNGLASPFDPGSPYQGHSGGDSFDLDSVNMDSVFYLRIKDAGSLVPDGGPAFDLDAVSVIHQAVNAISYIDNEIPAEFQLKQNYPNPFNPVTNIEFSLKTTSYVKLSVLDMLGKEIKILTSGKLNAGNYKVEFDASGLSSGVYYYRLSSDNFTDTKKMILIK